MTPERELAAHLRRDALGHLFRASPGGKGAYNALGQLNRPWLCRCDTCVRVAYANIPRFTEVP